MITKFKAFYWPIILNEWDRILIGVLFLVFVVDDLLRANLIPVPFWFELFRVVQFAIAGIAFIAGAVSKDYWIRWLGLFLYSTGVLTAVPLTIYQYGFVPRVWLLLAFAVQGLALLRRLKMSNKYESLEDIRMVTKRKVR